MELNSMWDDAFFSMMTDESLDYEFDENDLFKITEDSFKETVKAEVSAEVGSFMQSDIDSNLTLEDRKILVQADIEKNEKSNFSLENNFLLNNEVIETSFASRQDSGIRPDINRNYTTEYDNQIIIDARIFLDSHNENMQSVNSVPLGSNDLCQLNFSKSHRQSCKLIKGTSLMYENCPLYNTRISGNEDVIKKTSKDHQISSPKARHHSYNKKKKNDSATIHDKKNHLIKNKSSMDPDDDKPKHCSDVRNKNNYKLGGKKDTRVKTEKIYKRNKKSLKSTSTSTPLHKKCDKVKTNANSHIHKSKKVDSKHSATDKHRVDKIKIKSEPNTVISEAESNEDLEWVGSKIDSRHTLLKASVEATSQKPEQLKISKKKRRLSKDSNKGQLLPADRKNTLSIKRENLQLEESEPSEQKINLPKDSNENAFLSGRTSALPIKRERNIKIESALDDNLFHSKVVLLKIPDYNLCGIAVRTEFKAIKPKVEIMNRKPVLRTNLTHFKRSRVVLKKLINKELRSPKTLLMSVKSEINESVSRKLRSQATLKNYIHIYCCNCKSLQVGGKDLSKKKNCETCDSRLIYLCAKCNEKHYAVYYHVQRHLKRCRGSGETKPILESIALHCCTECSYKSTYSQKMAWHVKNTGHTADGEIDINKLLNSPKERVKREVSNEIPMSPKLPRTRYAKLIVNQNASNVAAVTERYCSGCNESQASKTRQPKESCRKCNTPLHLQCLKCGFKQGSYRSMLRHLRSKCQPNSFKCVKCDHTGSMWSAMQQHVMEHHDKRAKLNGAVMSPKRRRRIQLFRCEFCVFETKYSHSLNRHTRNLHKE